MVRFLPRQLAARFLSADDDNYIKSMTSPDLHARGAASAGDYISMVTDACASFTDEMKVSVKRITKCVDKEIETNTSLKTACVHFGIQPEVLRNIPWILALTRGNVYDEGYPHTRDSVIFISTQFFSGENTFIDQCRTLLHEKIHLFQRAYRPAFLARIRVLGYKHHMYKHQVPMLRSNPDLDKTVYRSPTGEILACIYRSPRPLNINDVTYTSSSMVEHPFEEIAYHLASIPNDFEQH